jgi:UDP-3-O-[3-hydroxymyristoyl] glucosamine N-acyltransferase
MSSKDAATLTGSQLAKLVGAAEHPSASLRRVSTIEEAGTDAIVFAQDEAALQRALESKAGAILARRAGSAHSVTDPRILWVRDPRYAMALVGRALKAEADDPPIHPAAIIHSTAKIGARTRVGPGAVIEANAVTGEDCVIAARATLCRGVEIGSRVIVQSGAVLGAIGFGYVRDHQSGEYLLFPQQGRLIVEDDVEIGANTTIDRGALGETRIGAGTKIDNLVHIGHNCIIGKNVIIAAQVGLSGSCIIEDGVILAGQVGLGDHVHLGPGVVIGGQGGVFPGKTVEGPGQVFAGTPAEPLANYLKTLARIRRLK